MPAHDSTAVIIDKGKIIKENQERLYYIIHWPDLPNVRLAIPCVKALEYISPWEMEEWEYKDALQREDAQGARNQS